MHCTHSWRRLARPLLILLLLAGVLLGGSACWPLPADNGAGAPATLIPASSPTAAPARLATAPAATVAVVASPTPGPTYTPAPESGDQQLTMIGGADDPTSLDPALATDEQSLFVLRQLFSGLVRFDDNLNIVPDLAAALPVVSADGITYTFTLRPDVHWPDGRPVTAADVAFSLERATDPALAAPNDATTLPAATYLNDIAGVSEKLAGQASTVRGISVVDAQTIRFTLTAPRANFLAKLTTGPGFLVDRQNVTQGAEWWRQPVGTGPFRLRDWQPHESLTLVPNPAASGGAPRLAQVTLLLGANAAGALVQYEQGGVDVTRVAPDDLARVADPGNPLAPELISVPELSTTYLGFNVAQPPFDDANVRRAFSLALDRNKIAQVMFKDRVRAAVGMVPPGMPGYQTLLAPTTLDVTQARQLLAESPYRGATNLPRLTLYTTGGDLGPMVQAVLQQNLGITVELRAVEWSDYLDGLRKRQYPLFLLAWGADWPDPSAVLDPLFRSDSADNYLGFADPQIDDALHAAATERDPATRNQRYATIEQQILAGTPAVPLLHGVTYMLIRPYVHGVQVTPEGILSLRGAYLSSRTGEDASP